MTTCKTCNKMYVGLTYVPNIGHQICTRDDQGRLHSFDDEPAIIHLTGTKMWYNHGKLHRIGIPAVEYSYGLFEYWENGQFIKHGVVKVLVPDSVDSTIKHDIGLFPALTGVSDGKNKKTPAQ